MHLTLANAVLFDYLPSSIDSTAFDNTEDDVDWLIDLLIIATF